MSMLSARLNLMVENSSALKTLTTKKRPLFKWPFLFGCGSRI